MFVAAQVYTHTHFSTTLKTQTPRAFDPSAFFFFFQGEDANLEEMML